LSEDFMVRNYVLQRLQNSMVSKVCIDKTPKTITIHIHTARPGQVIGRKGAEIEKLRAELKSLVNGQGKLRRTVGVEVQEIKKPEIDAKLIGEDISRQLKARVSFRRAMKRAIGNAMRNGAKGIKIQCSGRLGGAEMARTEGYKEGQIPLHTLRANIDYALTESVTSYGVIGIKVWVYHGEVFK